ncbi:hypothetical protein VTK56DRAFT_8551 [Thermocarpiscus australiensis]
MADDLPPSGVTVMALPNETLLQMANYLGERDLRNLSLVNRRLSRVAHSSLRNKLYGDPLRCKEVLLWAVENCRHDLLRDLLERGVSPNFLYLSSFLRSRLLDVFAAQGRRGTAGPRKDLVSSAETFRENYCRHKTLRDLLWADHLANHREVPLEDDLVWNLEALERTGCRWNSRYPEEKFGGYVGIHSAERRFYYFWAPIHVAVQLGDNVAAQLLLEHGADVNVSCCGLCGCVASDLAVEEDVGDGFPHRLAVWKPLHVAMCSGNEEAVRLLISYGSSISVGGRWKRYPAGPLYMDELQMSAFQNAAWLGSLQICQILLEEHRFRSELDRANIRLQTALHYAAAAGHIRTVGKLLLDHGATFPYYEASGATHQQGIARALLHESNDPLRLLCMQFNYDDAWWFLHNCRELHVDRNPTHLYTRALAALCASRRPAVYVSLSSRERQDLLYRLADRDANTYSLSENTTQEVKDSRCRGLRLAKELLDRGTDPNRAEVTDLDPFNEVLPHRRYAWDEPPLRLAIRGALGHSTAGGSGRRMVEVLLNAGASLGYQGSSALGLVCSHLISASRDGSSAHPDWARITELLLKRGAVSRLSDRDWESLMESACRQDNTHQHAQVCGDDPVYNKRGSAGGPDSDVVRWVLRQCVDPSGNWKIPESTLDDLRKAPIELQYRQTHPPMPRSPTWALAA